MTKDFPASVGQRLLWMLQRYRGANGALNCPVLLRLRGPLDTAALRAALAALVRRHEALRTVFTGQGARLSQSVRPPRTADIPTIDVADAADPMAALHDELLAELRTPIDTTAAPVRFRLVEIAAGDHVLCLNVHHLATDAWSNGVLSRELGEAYEQALRATVTLPTPPWQYRDFVDAQQRELTGERLRRLQNHWRETLRGARFPDLPGPRGRRGGAGAYLRVPISGSVVTRLEELSRAHRTTLFTAMLTLYFVAIRRRTGATDQAVASIFANRTRPEAQGTVGFLANPLILRSEVPHGASFVDLLDRTRRCVLDAFVHQSLPYPMVPLDTFNSEAALDVVFQMFAEPVHQTQIADLHIEPFPMPDGWGTRFDLDLSVIPEGGALTALAAYTVNRFDAAWVHNLLSDYAGLATEVAQRPHLPLC